MARKGSPRVARDVRAAIADALGSLVADPRLALVTITEVELTPDHEHATVYWSTPDPGIVSEDRRRGGARPSRTDEVAAALDAATPLLRGAVGRRVRLRVTPELRFRPDPVAEQVERVERLLRDVLPHPGTDGAADGSSHRAPDASPEGGGPAHPEPQG
jgi:ribosome-binding factor A